MLDVLVLCPFPLWSPFHNSPTAALACPRRPLAQIPAGHCLRSGAPRAPPSSHNALFPTLILCLSSTNHPGLSPLCPCAPSAAALLGCLL